MKALLFAAIFASQYAFAFVPAPGLWQTDSIDGQGFNIETQDNVMIVTAYVFDGGGNQIWYLAAGTYNETTSQFSAPFAKATGGSCLNCLYKAPTKSLAGGNLLIVFSSRETATAYFDGGSRPLTHLNYGYSGNQGYFNGKWEFSYQGFAGIVNSQWVTFPGTTYFDSASGTNYNSGVEDQYSNSVALAQYKNGVYFVGVADGYGNQWIYQFTGDSQHMLGLGYVGSVTSTPYIAQGSRIFTPHELTDPAHAIANPQGAMDRYAALAAAMRGVSVQN